MKLLICGHGRHGKDTVADLLTRFNGYKSTSSSLYVMKLLEHDILAHTGYKSFEDCYENRGQYRAYLYNLIREYNTPDKSRLTKEILKEYQIYVGMRDLEEFNASKYLFDLMIWVDSSDRGIPLETPNSFNIPRNVFDIVIENNDSYDELVYKVKKISNVLRR